MKRIGLILIFCGLIGSLMGQEQLWQYQKMALDSNLTLQAKYKQYEIALERIPQVKSLSDPKLSFAYGLIPIETRLGAQQAKFSVSQSFPWFGTLSTKEKQAVLQTEALFSDYLSVRNRVIYELSAIWYDLYLLKRNIHLVKKQREIFGLLVRQANVQFESSQTSMVNVLRFQMAEEELQTKIENLKDRQQATQVHFNGLLNRESEAEVVLPDSLTTPSQMLFVLDSIFSNNPSLKAIDKATKASEEQIKISRLEGFPNISLGIDYSLINERSDMVVDGNGTDAIMPMISISLPIYRKKYRAKKLQAELNKEKLIRERKQLKISFLSAHEKNRAEYKTAMRNLQLNENLLKKAQQALNILKTAYSTSGKDYDQLLSIQNSLLKYQIERDKALVDLYKSIAYRSLVLNGEL